MIEFSSSRKASALANRLGVRFQMFLFGGTVPTTIEEIPFNLFITSERNLIEGYQVLDYNSIYNNMQSQLFCLASNTNANRFDTVVFEHELNNAGLPKLSFFDINVQKYRHIPQTMNIDFAQYDEYSGTNLTGSHQPHACIAWPQDTGRYSHFKFDTEASAGGTLEFDFGYEADITEIVWKGNANNNFEGNMEIYTWDQSLNEGAGDWVLFHTHVMSDPDTVQDIILPSPIASSKLRFVMERANDSANSTIIETIEFFGTAPDTLPDTAQPITWALLVPLHPNKSDFDSITREQAFIMLTAGGPADGAEFIVSQSVCDPGRINNLLTGKIRFSAKEY